ncbi:MAG: ABC transporter permease subunit [Verrucomicrobiales bacterium]|jgi:spermidine/putrescine transport system permease protein|nr:ABC transporter permease subunit [Verrucomicrobiales bacterium]MDP4793134.1 ABC transporter permease subunit [Verrucomicrobiales bacterium]MDP4940312.1 ABC transporter permease subunit [Verrucomicrobiales bacterium]MDP5006172.1 ABC transporter permease subunit [Verrucomicrobiales bacterium]
MKSSRLPAIVFALVVVFLYVPILFLVVNSFNEARFSSTWTGFTLKWYAALFDPRNRDLWEATQRTLLIAISSSAVSMVLGTLSACALHWYRTKLQRLNYGMIYLPIIIPDLLMGISLLLFFVALGVTLGTMTILIAHITFCASFVTVVVLGRLQGFDESVIAAARDLGATRWVAIRRVILPLLAPGIVAGGLLSFTLSVDDYVITFFVTGPGSTTLPLKIYSMVKHSTELPLINAISTIFLVVTFLIVWWSQKLTRDQTAKSH